MKYFFFILLFLNACKNEKKGVQKISNHQKNGNLSNVEYPYRTEKDSGYFQGYRSISIDSLVKDEDNHLTQFLSKIINTKDIVLLSDQTLSHSVFINPQNKLRLDTLRNKECLLVSEYFFGEKEYQKIKINETEIRNYKWNGVDSAREDVYSINEKSFRYFSFHGKPYYYFNGNIMDMGGYSSGNIYYHFVFDINANSLSVVYSCRFGRMLVGDADGDEYLDFLHFDNTDFCTTIPYSDKVTIWLYSLNPKGNFLIRKDLNGKEYFIAGRTGEGFSQDSFIVKKYYWPVRLNK